MDYNLNLIMGQRTKALEKIWKEAWYTHLCDSADEVMEMASIPQHKEIMKKYLEKRKGGRWTYIMFVINPRSDVTLDGFLKKIEKCLKKKWIVKWMWNIEQRGKNLEEMGKGMHANILCEIKENKYCYNCKREVYNTFKNLVGNAKHICARYANDSTNFKNYIMGIKKDKEKDILLKYDDLWRKKNNLKKYYIKK